VEKQRASELCGVYAAIHMVLGFGRYGKRPYGGGMATAGYLHTFSLTDTAHNKRWIQSKS
jgi:hypothetical protein